MKKTILKSIFAVGASSIMLLAQTATSGRTGAGQTASTDSEMTSKVHQALMSDSTVGTAAQHIRVTTKNGVVTLRGRVESAAEKDEAVAKAKQIAGDSNVKDDITVSKK